MSTALLLTLRQLLELLNQNPMPGFSKGLPTPSGMLLGLILYTAWYGLLPLFGAGAMLTGMLLFMPPLTPAPAGLMLTGPGFANPCPPVAKS